MFIITLKIKLYIKKIKTYFLLKKMIKISKKLTKKQLSTPCHVVEVLHNIKQIILVLEHIKKHNLLKKYQLDLLNDIKLLQEKYNLY